MSTNTTTDTDRDRLEAELRRRIHRNLPVHFMDEMTEDCGEGTVEWTPRGPSTLEACVFRFVADDGLEASFSFAPNDVVLVEYREDGEWRMNAWLGRECCRMFDYREDANEHREDHESLRERMTLWGLRPTA